MLYNFGPDLVSQANLYHTDQKVKNVVLVGRLLESFELEGFARRSSEVIKLPKKPNEMQIGQTSRVARVLGERTAQFLRGKESFYCFMGPRAPSEVGRSSVRCRRNGTLLHPGTEGGAIKLDLSLLRDRLSRPPGSLLSSFSLRGTRLSDTPHTRICLCLFSLFRRSGEMSPLSAELLAQTLAVLLFASLENAASQNRRQVCKANLPGTDSGRTFLGGFSPGREFMARSRGSPHRGVLYGSHVTVRGRRPAVEILPLSRDTGRGENVLLELQKKKKEKKSAN